MNSSEIKRVYDLIEKAESIDELRNIQVVLHNKWRELQRSKVAAMLAAYRVGDVVTFEDKNGKPVVGKIRTVNEKTCTIDAEDGGKWRVHPTFLRLVEKHG